MRCASSCWAVAAAVNGSASSPMGRPGTGDSRGSRLVSGSSWRSHRLATDSGPPRAAARRPSPRRRVRPRPGRSGSPLRAAARPPAPSLRLPGRPSLRSDPDPPGCRAGAVTNQQPTSQNNYDHPDPPNPRNRLRRIRFGR